MSVFPPLSSFLPGPACQDRTAATGRPGCTRKDPGEHFNILIAVLFNIKLPEGPLKYALKDFGNVLQRKVKIQRELAHNLDEPHQDL